jgi:hypothetical protein
MRSSAIRHLAITDESSIVAAALFEKTVQIWSWKTGQQLGEFQTMLDFGGRRLALTPDGSACIVGAWGLLWNRKDIRHIQHVRLSGSGREIYCGVEGSAAHIIETATGESVARVRGTTKIVGSQYSSHQLVAQRGRYLVRGESEFEIPTVSFAMLDAVFSPDALCLSEPKDLLHPSEAIGGIRSIDMSTGALMWCADLHSTHLAYNSSDRRFYCVAAADTAPPSRSLIRLGSSLLEHDQIVALGACWEEAFSPSGKVLVTVHGDVYETSTGTPLAYLDFPQCDYPDI